MVVATASATATGASNLRYSSGLDQRRLRPPQKFTSYTKFAIHYPNCLSSKRVKGYFPIRALDPQRGGEEEEVNSKDDLEYLGKVVAGSLVAAASNKVRKHSFA
ncbi:uncharacterized protein LOC125477089 isoform X2 [Pyrus x bretschneideri]|uniref:uncharacterized protein LOC125477089 isoform X2 n=1 Tax=Pyrus x bretschneideri TaxID=225117 RepID=UPI00202F6380|nr:uncharacterized protein LOC125477089 isoform X2 [Pyrus x bretschneideri]